MSLGCIGLGNARRNQLESYPRSWEEFCSTWLRGKGPYPTRLIIYIFSGFAWALWTYRNKMAINKTFPQVPTDIVYIALSLVQKWSIKLKEKDQDQIVRMKATVSGWLKNFKPSVFNPSDVVEI
jgi:hypothetical protein